MSQWIENVRYPERYHGAWFRAPFFEGWYYKLIDPLERYRYAVIPGMFVGADDASSHAFIQILDGTSGQATYHPYPVADFEAAPDRFDVRIGPNRFQLDQIQLDVHSDERRISGQVHFTGITPWPVSWLSPGIMGWFSWIPFMECYHGVLGLDHSIEGTWLADGQPIEWTGGRGYIEKDWGRAFPQGWIWMQSNHFEQVGTSLTLSIAIIPWLGSAFRGFIIGLWHDRTLYRFATYTGARIESLSVATHTVDLSVRGGGHRLTIHAIRTDAGVLRGPSGADMGVRVPESLLGRIDLRLTRLAGGRERTLFSGHGRNAGIEVVGDIQRLLRG